MRSLAALPIAISRVGSSNIVIIASAKASGFLGGTQIPVSPIIEEDSPTSVATHGVSTLIASAITFGKASEEDIDRPNQHPSKSAKFRFIKEAFDVKQVFYFGV